MPLNQKAWTDEDVQTARRLLDEKAPNEVFLATLGRTRNCCYAKVDRTRYTNSKRAIKNDAAPPVIIPSEVLEDAIRRYSSPRSITARLCGDPAPGQSALDRRAEA